MFQFDQIAARTTNIDKAVDDLKRLGHQPWVRDTVEAVHLFGHPAFVLGDAFKVRLAFNYELFPGLEYELIQIISGRTCQLTEAVHETTSMSHFGYHVPDPAMDVNGRDHLVDELKRLEALGMVVAQVSQTVDHEGTSKRYRYAFVFFPTIGAPIKIIQRITDAMTVEQGREAYAWLSAKG